MAEYDYDLYIDGRTMPPPAREGIVESDQLIWSENAGRTASGHFVGDIIASKKTLTITWNELTYAEFLTIKNAISQVGKPFVDIRYVDCSGEQKTFRGYTEGLTGTIVTYTGAGRVSNVTLNAVQQ